MNTQPARNDRQIDLDPTQPHLKPRDGDRRDPEGGLFAYNGPERRSGRDRREQRA